jgi:myo-inositol-1-phosphate synthase
MTSDPLGRTFRELYPFADPTNIEFGGWDIQNVNLSEAVQQAGVLNWQIEEKLRDQLSKIKPMRGYYSPGFIASNQRERANHVIDETMSLVRVLGLLRENIREFKERVGRVVVMWTANTERMIEEEPDVHYMWADLFKAIIEDRRDMVSPSMLYAIASILEGCPYVNGSPQNTFVGAVRELARREKVYIGGSDFKTGQTRFKSMMADYLACCGIRIGSIASYNHLGNNDGKNLSEDMCFRSKELSKRDVIQDIVEGNPRIYEGISPDHCIVIKYLPRVGDSKRALDEYVCDIFMGGEQTFSVYNVCEDSLLAAAVMVDILLVTELFSRLKPVEDTPHLTPLSLFFKSPLPDEFGGVVNSFRIQYRILEDSLQTLL